VLILQYERRSMTKALYTDKQTVINILTESFADNKSVNYVLKQDKDLEKRLQQLMDYSFEACYHFGEIFFSDDKKACALIIFPDRKKTTTRSIVADVQLMLKAMGLNNVRKAMKREAAIKNIHPKELIYYLWFIGVNKNEQGKGIGSGLMKELINRSNILNRPIYLETSTLKNLPWYEKFGFTIYNELDFGYRLYCLKRE
jgi:ribosomal protein S18 acetylase RimI-like enzyme